MQFLVLETIVKPQPVTMAFVLKVLKIQGVLCTREPTQTAFLSGKRFQVALDEKHLITQILK